MSYHANPKEVANVSSLPAFERYQYLVNKIADWSEVWSVGSDDGWALFADDRGVELCPIWPAEAFAKACCIDDWATFTPKSIVLEEWLDKWIPGLSSDRRKIAVFPLSNDKGLIVEPYRIERDLRDVLDQLE